MKKQNVTVASHKEKSTLVRPKFGPGMLLQHEDLDLMTDYTQQLSRLMFRSLFGCGVICGLSIETKRECEKEHVIVQSGVGLDCSGYPIQVPKDQRLTLGDQVSADNNVPLWVVLCGTVTCCAPRTALCASDEDEATSVCTQERDGFEIKVVSGVERPKCVCGCDAKDQCKETDCQCVDPTEPCYQAHYQGECGCQCDECPECDCKCILLARLVPKTPEDIKIEREKAEIGTLSKAQPSAWKADHSVRRFIRPVLMRDPKVKCREKQSVDTAGGSSAVARAEAINRA